MQRAIMDFIADLAVEGRGVLTMEAHERYLSNISKWFDAERLDWQTVTRREIQRYMRLFVEKAISTRNNLATSLRTFYRWAVEQGYVAMSPAAYLKTVRRLRPLPQSLTKDMVRRLVVYLSKLDDRRGRRDRALILTGLYSGLRASELAGLRWSSIDMTGGVINVQIAKMGHGRAVPLHPELQAELTSWREHQALAGHDLPVFSLDGLPIVPERAGKICRQHSAALRIPFHTHSLRHTFATMMLRHSGNLYAVSKALGHLDIKQTEIYLSANVEDLRKALATLPGLEDW